MINLFNFVKSFFGAVAYRKGDQITVIIRGTKFHGQTWKDVCRQVRGEAEYLRRRLSGGVSDATRMLFSAGMHGRWNVAAVSLKNTVATLEAYESFLRSNCL